MPTTPHHVVTKAKSKPVSLSISETSERVGISAAVLRVWETRYGWPRPARSSNGYRVYPAGLIVILERVSAELKRGKTIGDLMRDAWWQQVFESGRLPEPQAARVRIDPPWSNLPPPLSPLGRDVSTRLQQALVTADARLEKWAQAMGQQLHPKEREMAVTAVLRMWHQHQSETR